MNSGMYAAVSGSLAAMQKLDVVTNNLANAGTPGFKRDRLLFESLVANAATMRQPVNPAELPVHAREGFGIDFAPGSQQQSGNVLDLALEGEGFFVVNTPQGRAYTRQGNFTRDAAGKLVTADGYEVLGSGGPLVLNGSRIEIDSEGKILVDDNEVGSLQVVDFPKPYALQKIGSALFVPTDPQVTAKPAAIVRVGQGYLEESNVNAVLEMAQLIETSRLFEMCQKIVRGYDDMAAKAANELGRV